LIFDGLISNTVGFYSIAEPHHLVTAPASSLGKKNDAALAPIPILWLILYAEVRNFFLKLHFNASSVPSGQIMRLHATPAPQHCYILPAPAPAMKMMRLLVTPDLQHCFLHCLPVFLLLKKKTLEKYPK
jgi:hypothetical protein